MVRQLGQMTPTTSPSSTTASQYRDVGELNGGAGDEALIEAIRGRLREVLLVQTRVELVAHGSLQRSDYKSKLVHR